MNKIQEKYKEKCETPSDINELLPTLKKYADQCHTVVELGVRKCTSTYAFLASEAAVVYGYDIDRYHEVSQCEIEATESDKMWIFVHQDVLKADIPICDMLFIDTHHSKLQLEKELELHAGKAQKFLAFHDTSTFWENAEPGNFHSTNNGVDGKQGLRYAIEPFLEGHPQWQVAERLFHNNGLLVLRRIGVAA